MNPDGRKFCQLNIEFEAPPTKRESSESKGKPSAESSTEVAPTKRESSESKGQQSAEVPTGKGAVAKRKSSGNKEDQTTVANKKVAKQSVTANTTRRTRHNHQAPESEELLRNRYVCFTDVKERKAILGALVIKHGGRTIDRVTTSVNLVVCDSPGTVKCNMAKDNGIQIMTSTELRAFLSEPLPFKKGK